MSSVFNTSMYKLYSLLKLSRNQKKNKSGLHSQTYSWTKVIPLSRIRTIMSKRSPTPKLATNLLLKDRLKSKAHQNFQIVSDPFKLTKLYKFLNRISFSSILFHVITELKPEPEAEPVPEQEEPEPVPEQEEPEPELTDGQRHIWNCKTVIDNVRHEEFGVGMQLDEKSRQLMERHQERIGRSLQRLSEELYSKDTHFVLELIQNADDNKYDVGTEPSLVFVVDKEAVTSMNNERGFCEQDIRALCDVGKSTKGKHKHGYIGMLAMLYIKCEC